MKPILPVRQKPQSIAQPTWLEMQNVIAGVSGMNTDSMRRPSASSSRNFCVPSEEMSRETRRGAVKANSAASRARSSRLRSVICSGSVTPRRCTQRNTWRAWNGANPEVAEAGLQIRQFERRQVGVARVRQTSGYLQRLSVS